MLFPHDDAAPRVPRVRGAVVRTFGSLDTYNYRLYFAGDLVSHIGGVDADDGRGVARARRSPAAASRSARRSRAGSCPCCCSGCGAARSPTASTGARCCSSPQSLAAVLAVVLWLIVLTGVVQVVDGVRARDRARFRHRRRRARPPRVRRGDGRARPRRRTRSRSTSAVGNSARITGPAIAGLLIATVGTSWVFFVNAVSFFAVVARAARDARGRAAPPATGTATGRGCAKGSRTRGASPRSAPRSCSSRSSARSSTTSRPSSR